MRCNKCQQDFTIKVTEGWITLMCKCSCITIYPDGYTSKRSREEYNPKYRKRDI